MFSRLFRIWIPLVVLLTVVLWLFHRVEEKARLAITRANEHHAIHLSSETATTELAMLHSDVLYLAKISSMSDWLDSGSSPAYSNLAADLLNFAQQRRLYDQVRFLDEHGQEVVRINWNQGHPYIVSKDTLQNKSDRYYVQNSLVLDRGQIYYSPFDLNIEEHEIERPIKPVIRLGTPVFDREGRKRGIIVLNYLGQRLLDRLREIRNLHDGELWLLNAEGYWLLGDNPAMEWGFMFPERKEMRFGRKYSEIWSDIQKGDLQSQRLLPQGLFTFTRIAPRASANDVVDAQWTLVAYVPSAMLTGKLAENDRGLLIVFILLALLLWVVSGMIAYNRMHRRQGEIRIRESEARFRGLLDSAPDAIVIVDQSGTISLVNSQAENWFGYSRNEMLGEAVEMLVPERFRKHHVTERDNYIAHPVSRPMGGEAALYGLRKNGSEFPVEISLSPLLTDQGQLVTSVIRDITARKQVELSRQRVQAQYQQLVNNLPVGVYRNTPGMEGKFVEVNPAMVEIFEADSIEALLARPVSALYRDPADRKAFSDKVMREGYANAEELCLKTLKNREFFAAITAVKKQDENGNIYFDGIVEDISKRKENERRIRQLNETLRTRSVELETINRELEAFSYSVSHDLRAPLRAIDGFSRIVLNDYSDRLDDKGKDRLGRVRSAAQHMAMLIDDLLKLSRVSRSELKREVVEVSGITDEVLEVLRNGEPGREVHCSVQTGMKALADPRLLRIVLDNLLGNAWKFTGRCQDPSIEVGQNTLENETVFFVRDNGSGFDMTYAGKLFGAFQRLHDASEFPGTGIGLATVQRIIHKHGGRIWAEGEVGKGATFFFTLDGGHGV